MRVQKRHFAWGSLAVIVGAVLTAMTLLVDWAIRTDEKLRTATTQRDSLARATANWRRTAWVRDSLADVRISRLEKVAGIKRREAEAPPPPTVSPPRPEGLFQSIFHRLFWR